MAVHIANRAIVVQFEVKENLFFGAERTTEASINYGNDKLKGSDSVNGGRSPFAFQVVKELE
jgi:hypothetical protein